MSKCLEFVDFGFINVNRIISDFQVSFLFPSSPLLFQVGKSEGLFPCSFHFQVGVNFRIKGTFSKFATFPGKGFVSG